jgi:hypothetical protein
MGATRRPTDDREGYGRPGTGIAINYTLTGGTDSVTVTPIMRGAIRIPPMNRRIRRSALCLALSLGLAAPFGGATAQTIPSGGELLQQTPRPALPTPSSDVGLTINQPVPSQLPSSDPFMVRHIEIIGNTLLPSSELLRNRGIAPQPRGITPRDLADDCVRGRWSRTNL